MTNFFDMLIPKPKEINKLDGTYGFIKTNFVISTDSFDASDIFNEYLQKYLGFKLKCLSNYNEAQIFFILNKNLSNEEYILEINNKINIKAGSYKGLLNGIYTLLQIIKFSKNCLPRVIINDKPTMQHRGFYHDVTRGKMPKLSTLKQYIDYLSYFKFTEFQIYIEHTFAFEGLSEVWFDKNPLKPQDIIELDNYATKRGIELIPSLTTFGHMYEILRTQKYKELCERENPDVLPYSFIDRMEMHTLDTFNPKAFELVCKMIDQYIPLFKSNKFNIGADETFDLCKHKNKDKLPEHFKVYKDFALKVADYVKCKGKTVMIWDDIILKSDQEFIESLPDDLIYLDWDYSAKPSEDLRAKIAQKPDVYFCSGTSAWNKLIPDFKTALSNIDNMLVMAQNYGVNGYYLTNWGDFGDICSSRALELLIAYTAAVTWEGSIRHNKEDFYTNLGKLLYNDENIIGYFIDISKYHIITYFELIYSLDEKRLVEHNICQRVVEMQGKLDKLDYSKLAAIEDILYSKLTNFIDKALIIEMINICHGVRLFNKFDLQSYSFNGKFECLTNWYYDYINIYRLYNTEGELARNTEIMRALMLRFRQTK